MDRERMDANKTCHRPCISWTAIILGALVGLGLNFLLNLFYLGLGIAAFSASAEGALQVLMGAFVFIALTSFFAMFFAGWVAGFLGRQNGNTYRGMGELYGFASWCISVVFIVLLASHTSNVISTYNNVLNPSIAAMQSTSQTAKYENVTHKVAKKINAEPSTQAEENATVLGATTFATFFIFFIGALASCFGGYCGMFYRCKNNTCTSSS